MYHMLPGRRRTQRDALLDTPCLQPEPGENFRREPAEHAALSRVRNIDDEVRDPYLRVLVDDLGDPFGIAVQRVPRADVRLVLAGTARVVGDHAIDLALVAEDGVELERLQNRVVVAAHPRAVLAQHLELVPDCGDVRVEVARVAVLRDQLQRHLLAATADPDRRGRRLPPPPPLVSPPPLVGAAAASQLLPPPHHLHYPP